MPRLFVYPRKGEIFQHRLKDTKISLGRAEDNDLPIPDPFCSGHHAFIYPVDFRYMIRDNNSKNGTYLNGERIQGETELKKGDEILLGSTRIMFDKELSTNVEVPDEVSPSASINTIMDVKDVLKSPDISTTIRAPSTGLDIEKIRVEHKSFSVISEVSKALVLHMPLGKLLEHVMDLVGENLPMDRGILMLNEGNPVQLIPKVVRINNPKLMGQKILVSQSIVNMVKDRHSSVLISDVQADPRLKTRDSVMKMKISSAMCVPLWNNKEIIGIIYSDRIFLPKPFTEEDLRLLTLMANLAAVKIENSKLIEKSIEKEKMEKELELAAQIQRDFLPKACPEFPGFEIAGSMIPCYQVGGDYYDFIPITPERLGVTIADVSGKGVSASLLMASLRASLHAEVHPDYDIEKMASKLNDFVHRSSSINSFITFFFCDLDRKTGDMKFVNAGHNPPILLSADGKVRRLEPCGCCLGMFPSTTYPCRRIKMRPGDMAVLFTDGITESRNRENKEFEENRLVRILKKNVKKPTEDLVEKVFAELASYTSGAEPMDDMTLVLIKRQPQGPKRKKK